jgi:drug/metabolite transporter (DMT)-like permease
MKKGIIPAILAIISTLGFLIIFGTLIFVDVSERNADYFNMGLIALIGFVGTAFGFYMGSSEKEDKENKKDE